MRRTDGVEVTGEMQVDVFHWNHLRVTTTRGATLHAEAGSEARLAQADDRFLADTTQAIVQTDRGRGFTFSRRCWTDRGDQDQFAVGTILQGFDIAGVDLGLGIAERHDRIVGNSDFFSNITDRQSMGRACYFNVTHFYYPRTGVPVKYLISRSAGIRIPASTPSQCLLAPHIQRPPVYLRRHALSVH